MKGQFIILHCMVDGKDAPQIVHIYKVSQESGTINLLAALLSIT
jgi:hypothetical protein